MMMDHRENSLDRELIGHLQHVQFGDQHDFHQMHCWGEYMEERFIDGRKESEGVNGMEVRNKGPSPCNSQASLGYHSLPSSQCGSRPSSNPDYTVDYSTSSYEQSGMYLDSQLADSTDPCWRHNTSGQSMDMSVRGQNNCKESIRRCIDMEWRQWCHQQQQNLQHELPCGGNGHHGNHHRSNGIQTSVGMYPKQHVNHFTQQQNFFQQRNLQHSGYQEDCSQPSTGCWIPNSHNHRRSNPTDYHSRHQQRYEEPCGRVEMLSRSLNTCSQFRTCLPTEDPIYEEICEHNIILSNDTDCEGEGPNLPPRPRSWTSMVNLHQKSKAPVYFQIQPCASHLHHENCSEIQSERTKTVLSPTNSWKPSRGICTKVNGVPIDHHNRNDVSSINLPYFPYINRLFQEDSDISDTNGINNTQEKDSKSNEKKSGKRLEKFFGSLLSLNKSKGVKNMGTSTDEKTKDEINVEKHKKLRRTVSESCNIYSRGKGNHPTYEDNMCNLLNEIQINMKQIDHNSKQLHQNTVKEKRCKNSDIKTDKHEERRNSKREKKIDIKTESGEGKNERTRSHSNRRHQSITTPSPRHNLRNSSSSVEQTGVLHSVNHQAIKTVINDSRSRVRNSTTESFNNKSQCSTSHRKSSHRPAMGVQALLTRSSSNNGPETNPNEETNSDVSDSFERRLSHERTGSRSSFVYDYSEASDLDESEIEVSGVSGYASEAYAQGLASGEDNENWKDGDQVYGLPLAKPLFRNNVVATAKRRKLIEKVTEL